MYTVPTYRENVTDLKQSVIEEEQFEGGIPVFDSHKTREIVRAEGGVDRTQHGVGHPVNLAYNAGVIVREGLYRESNCGKEVTHQKNM